MRDERRSFLKAMAIAPAALAGAPLAALPAAPPPATAPPATAPPPASPYATVAESLAEAVRREHGAHLDAAALDAVKKEIAASLESAARMRSALRLGNADGPVTLFSARGRR